MKKQLRVEVVMMKKKKKKKHNTKHTPCFEMIKEAVLSLNNKNGWSPYAIAKLMEEKYNRHRHRHNSSSEALFLKQIKEEVEMQVLLKGKLFKTYIGFKKPNATQEQRQDYINDVYRSSLSTWPFWREETEEEKLKKKNTPGYCVGPVVNLGTNTSLKNTCRKALDEFNTLNVCSNVT